MDCITLFEPEIGLIIIGVIIIVLRIIKNGHI